MEVPNLIDKVRLLFNDQFLGIVIKDGEEFQFIRNLDFNDSLKYPYEFYQKLNSNLDNPVPSEKIREFFMERGFPEDRQGVEILLEQLGLSCYDYWQIALATNSKDCKDRYSIELIKNV